VAADERRSIERIAYTLGSEPELVVRYHDPVCAAIGHVVIDTLATGVAFGGMRIAKNIQWTELAPIARSSTIRYQHARVGLGGARLGLDYDPRAPNLEEVLGRFLTAIRALLGSSVSIGPDLNTPAAMLERVLAQCGLPWRMQAVQQAQGWPVERWTNYQTLLAASDEGVLLRDLQVPYSVAESVMAMGEFLFHRQQTVGVVGSGPFGLQIARLLALRGATVVAVGGSSAGVYAAGGLAPYLLNASGPPRSLDSSHIYITCDELISMPLDVLVLASGPDVVAVENVGKVRAALVIEAAARSISRSAEMVLVARGTAVLPNFAVTMGAVLLADAVLQGQVVKPGEAREFIGHQVHATIRELARLSATLRVSLRDAGVRLAFHRWDVPPPSLMAAEPPPPPTEEEPPEVL
jgi:glutamate dehydrogenase (NAD(P)+)